MKYLHRVKTLSAYEGARVCLKNELTYPSYMMLKEAARGVLSYVAEDVLDRDISDKTKLDRLVEFMEEGLVSSEDMVNIQKLISAENEGLQGILSIELDDLMKIKKSIKKLIVTYIKEPV